MVPKKPTNEISVYACGGCGVNIGKYLLNEINSEKDLFANLNITLIDTSISNLRHDDIDDSRLYIFKDLDGAGAVRSANYTTIVSRVKEILNKHPSSNVNIVMHSTGGGSGSVIGPVITRELLLKKELVIIIIIGSSSTTISIDNTRKTLETYSNMVKDTQTPLACIYYENDDDNAREVNDEKVIANLALLSMLFSGNNDELDSSDIRNFLHYQKVTVFNPVLSCIAFYDGTTEISEHTPIISVATLTDRDISSSLNRPIEYQTVGYVPKTFFDNVKNITLPVHTVLLGNGLNDIYKNLKEKKRIFSDLADSVVFNDIDEISGNLTQEGIIL